ncbi:polysaccharide deacetylase family protein [Marinicrinis lubricantis]|uniref:Polysaccharide deacetylase n=1 Tax=Marinicrinis lubricantis TaxID=2086470 RepID=A0ABW1IJB4_9BACL
MMNSVYRWPDGKRCAAAFSVDFDGESPFLWRTRNQPTDVVGELEQRAFGPREGIYRILDMLSRLDIRASFFIPGIIAERYPQAVEAIDKEGHEIGLHGYLHENVNGLSIEEIEESIVKGKQAIEQVIGPRTMGYRSPAWEMTKPTFDLLHRHLIPYDSSLMGHDHPYWIDGMPEIPVQWLLDDAIFYRFTGGMASIPPTNPNIVTDMWLQEFEGIKKYGGLFLLTAHCWITGRGSRLIALEKLLTKLKNDPEVWWATCGEIAEYHRVHHADHFHETLGG